MYWHLFKPQFLLLIASFLCATYVFSNEEFNNQEFKFFQEKIRYHLLIRNDAEAISQSSKAIQKYPTSLSLRKLHLEALSSLGAEKKLLRAYQKFKRDFPQDLYDDTVLESLAKGVLQNAQLSESVMSKYYRYALADAFTDSSSVQSLQEGFLDSNFLVREMALQAALSHGDEALLEPILELVKNEKVASVKRKAIEVFLILKGSEAQNLLAEVLEDKSLSYSDRLSFLLTLLDQKDCLNRDEIEKLAKSDQMIKRLIASYVFSYFRHQEDYDILLQLVNDPISDVREQAITSLGHLKVSEICGEKIAKLLKPIANEGTCETALLASWVALMADQQIEDLNIRDFLYHTNPKIRLQAASLIGYSLPKMLDLAKEFFQTHQDLFVRLNLSISLLLQRENVCEASNQIVDYLKDFKSAQFQASFPYPMQTIWPSSLIDEQQKWMSHLPPSVQSEIVEFCLLNLLATVEDSRAMSLISKFLETHHSDVALNSIAQFLKFESFELLKLIQSFFTHSDLNKRVQAAAIVALLKKDENALKVLHDSYPLADRKVKEMIVNIIGEIKSKDSIPFLTDAIYESSQTLRVVAAASLMKCLRN